MKKLISLIFALALIGTMAGAQAFESLKLINTANWAAFMNNLLGYQYPSRGDIHFYPADIYLLHVTIPPKTTFTIKKYRLEKEELPTYLDRLPYFSEITKSEEDLEKHARLFRAQTTEITVYPALNHLVIAVDGSPYAKVTVQPGLLLDRTSPITSSGDYSVLGITNRYLSGDYYQETVVPFGAWLKQINGIWAYQENGWWYRLPADVAADLELPPEQRNYFYFDENPDLSARRWGSSKFGRQVLFWTKDGTYRENQFGYAPGELLLDQVNLVKDLVDLLTFDGPAEIARFNSDQKLEIGEIDPATAKAINEYQENRLPRNPAARQKALELYGNYLAELQEVKSLSRRYELLKNTWPFLKELKEKLKSDFSAMGVLSIENRQNILEGWLTRRLEFKQAMPPTEAKYLQELAFTTFFKPDEKLSVFTDRESAVMRAQLRKIISGEAPAFELESVNALNQYNFGRLLNEILGDLYKSHGCLHVSPRNSYFLYEILPVDAKMRIHKYSDTISPEVLEAIPRLSDLADFTEDLEKLKIALQTTAEVNIEVYPSSGYWILYLKGQPLARLSVKGGPQKVYNQMLGRDAKGRPIFEPHLAYPTTPGTYYIFKKNTNYISNIYRDTTIIPLGGLIRRGDKDWQFQDKNGRWQPVPKVIEADLHRPPEAREFTYYDRVLNTSAEVVEMKWGSHPFGQYAIQTSVNKKTPFPELIHSSGDLMMEERQIINDLIALLSIPYDSLDDCVSFDPNFNFYKLCYDFTKGLSSGEALSRKERAAYRLHYNLPLASEEAAVIQADKLIAAKIRRGGRPDAKETKLLINSGIASKKKGRVAIDMKKIYGLYFDNYQYVVTLEKYAHHYITLKQHWNELNGLRRAMLKDFNNLVIKDPALFHGFLRELMLSRTRLERLTQANAFLTINQLLETATRK